MTRLGLALLVALALVGPAAVGGAAELDLRIAAAGDGRVLGGQEVALRPGEKARIVAHGLRLPGQAEPLEVVCFLTLSDETAERVRLDLHAMIRQPGSTVPLAWGSRVLDLGVGESGSFTVDGAQGVPGVQVAVRFGGLESAQAGELPVVKLAVALRVWEEAPGQERRLVEQRRLRLKGPAMTEVVLEPPGGAEGITLRLVALARDQDGADLAVAVRGRGTAARGEPERRVEVRLGWNDRLEVDGLTGPRGPLLVELQPER